MNTKPRDVLASPPEKSDARDRLSKDAREQSLARRADETQFNSQTEAWSAHTRGI
ncbi:hypothetical protein ACFOYW_08300 [Gryllotalpicola reticulitermitis]|uniref:Uncharacterized protein n=1 Tax=Gryllotalpicola reticulitermitis TaxID=1184153 RepID=A0ABV8Q7F6_9MICO